MTFGDHCMELSPTEFLASFLNVYFTPLQNSSGSSPVTSPNNPSSFLTSQLKLCVSCACHNPRRLMPLGFCLRNNPSFPLRKIIIYIYYCSRSMGLSPAELANQQGLIIVKSLLLTKHSTTQPAKQSGLHVSL